MTIKAVLVALLFAFGGFGVGLAHLATLRGNLRLYLDGGVRVAAVAAHVARLALLATVWIVAARVSGAVGLLAGFAGFLLARLAVTSRMNMRERR